MKALPHIAFMLHSCYMLKPPPPETLRQVKEVKWRLFALWNHNMDRKEYSLANRNYLTIFTINFDQNWRLERLEEGKVTLNEDVY